MSDRRLTCTRLAIHRAPGVPRGEGFTLADLDAAVVVIHGPNASGKTTTARALLALLAPDAVPWPAAELEGRFRLDGVTWTIHRDHDARTVRRDGRPAAEDVPVPADLARRYLVALPDLLAAEDKDFARAMAAASQGGFDLAALREDDAFRAPSRPRGKLKDLRDAEAAVREATARQQALLAEERSLAELRRELESLEAELADAGPVVIAVELQEKRRELAETERTLASYPDVMARLQGDELTVLEKLDGKIAELKQQRAEAEQRLRKAGADLAAARLPDSDAATAAVQTLTARLRELRAADQALAGATTRRQQAAAREAELRARLGDLATPDVLARLAAGEPPALDELHRTAVELAARRHDLERWRARLDAAEDGTAVPDPATVQRGLNALAGWLAAPPRPAGRRRATILGAALAAGLGAWGWARSWPVALAAAVLGGVLGWWLARRGGDQGHRTAHRDAFLATGLEPPAAWTVEAVTKRLGELADLAARAAARERTRQERALLDREEERLAADETNHQKRRQGLEAALGLTLPERDPWLPVVVDNLVTWQQAHVDLTAADAEVARWQGERDALLEKIATLLEPFDTITVDSVATAEKAEEDLKARLASVQDATTRRDAARRELEKAATDQARAEKDRDELLEPLELKPGRTERLAEWLADLPDYREHEKERDHLARTVADLAANLADRSDLRDADATTLAALVERIESAQKRKEALQTKITQIETRINEAKRGHALADALARRDQAKADLRAARDRAAAGTAGAVLLDWLHRRTVERSRPAVFRRAAELLARVTAGTLRLELATDGDGFLVRDAAGTVRPLDTLSAGERAQLLLAVRLAYLQEHEPVPLPLLLDEVLGTSDPERAAAVVAAVATVARERQVLVFTAQPEEVARWERGLREAGLAAPKVIDLADVRGRARAAAADLQVTAPPAVPAPTPGEDMAAYAARLAGTRWAVPRLNPLAPPERAHLFYLLDDPATLHRLLGLGITTWGQLRTLRMTGNLPDTAAGAAAAAAARVLDAALTAWREGRGRPVDRGVLRESGAVSGTFLDTVSGLAAEVEGDARRLLAALDAGRVPKWRRAKTETLREYLLAEGYLDERPVLDRADLRARVVAAVYRELQDGRLPTAVLERLLAALPDVPGTDAADEAAD